VRNLVALALVAVGFGLVPPAPAVAQQQTGASCAAVADDAERLACYDSVFRRPDAPADNTLTIDSNQPIPARPTGRKPATMTIACTDAGLRVSFSFAGQLLSETGNEAAISFQVQQMGSSVRSLPVSPDNTSIGFTSTRDSDTFLEMLEGGDNVIVRITPVRQRSVQVEFSVRGREDEIGAIREACAA
jgi:hypothetical protein